MGDTEAFLRDAYEQRAYLSPGTTGFSDLLSLADVDKALTGLGLRYPAVRLVQDGATLDPVIYTRAARHSSGSFDDLIDTARVLHLFASGATVVLQSLQRWWRPLGQFCREMQLLLGHGVQANAYLTPSGSIALAAHHDTHDVFVLQVYGSKDWLVREPLLERPLPRHKSNHEKAATQPVVLSTRLLPGQCVYIPRGHVHEARAQHETSLHITIGVLATTKIDILRVLIERAENQVEFRDSLPALFLDDDDIAMETVRSTVEEFRGWLSEQVSPVTSQLQEKLRGRRRPHLESQLLDIVDLKKISDQTVVQRRAAITCTLARDESRLSIRLADRDVHLPRWVEPAARRLLSGERLFVGELSDLLEPEGRLVLVRRLVREGALRTCHA